MRVYVLGTGSTGNCIVVEADGARVILEAGMNPTRATAQLRALGSDLFAHSPHGGDAYALGLFVTHHHGDHIAQLLPLARATSAPVYMHKGIDAPRARSRLPVHDYAPGVPVRLGPFTIDALVVPHDAPQVAIRVATATRSFGLATDLGHVPKELPDFLGACDLALIESNYCPFLLKDGPYPPRLKQRVEGPLGHLANGQTAELAKRLTHRRLSRLVLGHLSRANNTPERALEAVAPRCPGLRVDVLAQGAARALEVSEGAVLSNPFSQLALFP